MTGHCEDGGAGIDPRDLRRVLGRFVTGVTVVTYQHGGRPGCLTANAFTSVSLTPPLILISVGKRSGSHGRIAASGAFAVNILAESQEGVALRFAGRHREMEDPFDGISYVYGATGSPLLAGTVGWLDCGLYAIYEGGDHTLFLGEIRRSEVDPQARPLVFYAGGFRALGEDRLTDPVWAWDVFPSLTGPLGIDG